MLNIEIKISGPGGCLDEAAVLIYEALDRVGYNVWLSQPAHNHGERQKLSELHERHNKWTIKIDLDEQPWGG